MRETILLSPHPDDIALSIGGAILAGFFTRPLKIVTIFSRSISHNLKKMVCEGVTTDRLEEEIQFANSIGANVEFLHFPDALIRYGNISSIFQQRTGTLDPLFQDVLEALHSKVLSQDINIVAPLGIGNHVDHLIVSEICAELATGGLDVTYYEDLPYAAKVSLREISQRAKLRDSRLSPHLVDISDVFQAKLDNLQFYKSQITGTKWLEKVKIHAIRLGMGLNYLDWIIWSNRISRAAFTKVLRTRSRRLMERLWKVEKRNPELSHGGKQPRAP